MVKTLKLNLLRDSQRVVYLDAQVSDGAFEFRVTEQNLDRPKIAGLFINLRSLCSPHGMGAICAGVEPDGRHPSVNDPSILPCRQMLRALTAAWKQIIAAIPSNKREPRGERHLGLFGDLELYGSLRLLLNDGGPIADRTTGP